MKTEFFALEKPDRHLPRVSSLSGISKSLLEKQKDLVT